MPTPRPVRRRSSCSNTCATIPSTEHQPPQDFPRRFGDVKNPHGSCKAKTQHFCADEGKPHFSGNATRGWARGEWPRLFFTTAHSLHLPSSFAAVRGPRADLKCSRCSLSLLFQADRCTRACMKASRLAAAPPISHGGDVARVAIFMWRCDGAQLMQGRTRRRSKTWDPGKTAAGKPGRGPGCALR